MSTFSFEHSLRAEAQQPSQNAGGTVHALTARVLREVLLRWGVPAPEQAPLFPTRPVASPPTQPFLRHAAPAAPAGVYNTRLVQAALTVLIATVVLGGIYITLTGSLDTALSIFHAVLCVLFPPTAAWLRVCSA